MDRIKQKTNAKAIMRGNYALMCIIFLAYIVSSLTLDNFRSLYYLGLKWVLILPIATYALSVIGSFVYYSCAAYGTKINREFQLSDFSDAVNWDLIWQYTWLNVLMTLRVALWTLLLIVPGIIKMFEYSLIGFDFIENPGLETEEYFTRAKKMMYGKKMDFFILAISFFGWTFLAELTPFRLAGLYVYPYIRLTQYQFYLDALAQMDQTQISY